MPAKTHIMHGRDHETHGSDPIRGLLPATGGDYESVVRALTGLYAYWRLGETGEPWHDTSGVGPTPADLTIDGAGVPLTPDVDGALPAATDDGAIKFNYDGTGDGVGEYIRSAAKSFALAAGMTVLAWAKLDAGTGTRRGIIIGNTEHSPSGGSHLNGYGLHVMYPTLEIRWSRGHVTFPGPEIYAETPAGVATGEWLFVAGTYDNTDMKLYINGTLVATTSDPFGAVVPPTGIRIGSGGADPAGGIRSWYTGIVDEAAVFERALTAGELASLYQAGIGGTGGPGQVITIPPGGGDPIWAPPGTEVEHPGGEEEENPRSGTGATGPQNANDWYYLNHFEYVVLYDSSPARFDVPPRKWTRVPFNTVRIQRRWETEPGTFTDAWLPDDRGLTDNAKQGTLLVTPGMTFSGGPLANEQEISGWYAIEYPLVNWTQLPEYTGPGDLGLDHYARGARMTNVTKGRVLRAGAAWATNPSLYVFFQWPFFSPADGDESIMFSPSDNPFPLYQNWPARPLNKPLPYPKSPLAGSVNDYWGSVDDLPGFYTADMVSRTFVEAGDAISLQAWQDTPWPLRFSTNHYPGYESTGLPGVTPTETWRIRPSLLIYHYYDPDTVDHATGRLL